MTFTGNGMYTASSKGPRRRGPVPLLLAGLVAVLVVAGGAFAVVGLVATATERREDGFDAVAAVRVDNRTGGAVVVHGADDAAAEGVAVERVLRSSPLAEPEESARVDGDTLRVEADCDGWVGGACSVDYRIEVPEGTALTVETSSGAIEVRSVGGAVTAHSTTGAVELDDVRGDVAVTTTTGEVRAAGSGGSIEVESTTGSVDLSGFAADTVRAEASTAEVRVGGGFQEAEVSTTTGAVDVETDEAFRRITVETTTGAVDIRVPDAAYRVTGDSSTGERAVDVPTADDAAAEIAVDTTTGSVTVRAD
ncbi:DUF4097 family beta strand repeat-containing protein [Marinitenerispora sediminis]|uniref:DUF4097 domain-containing protein n=1 Tax=Marinitenerispora sediminis TaxID=1931232 RepID=A0A368T287_9ACTN|nr:DUF4097 family beta strand repeat-containing protein [Marinitenerispora sediminis]RCV49292.1 hypothetical protein DEF28_21210 [Marinitenerispora sediminis]RCV50548.1 hypothetical protein DEF23_21855 [Marinitenerispora sediminis]RCV54796.1 hypothetical protein DEF24_18800 [Marinitenerispora sediminis]